MRELAQKIWNEGKPVQQGDEVSRYLRNRGLFLTEFPNTLRVHPSLGYYVTEGDVSKRVADYPAMLALVQDPDGGFVTLHRTYLKDGQKARGHGRSVASRAQTRSSAQSPGATRVRRK